MKTVLFTNGLPDNRLIKAISFKENLIFNSGGSANIFTYLDFTKFNGFSLMLDMNENSEIKVPNQVSVIFNQISEPDLYIVAMSKVVYLAEQLKVPILNHPKYVLNTRRDTVYQKLSKINKVTVPKTLRFKSSSERSLTEFCSDNELKLPIILREIGSHGGTTTHLLTNSYELSLCNHFALRDKTYYLTEYHDYKSNGLYIKTRLVVVGDDFFIRHTIASTQWEVHAKLRNKEYEWIELDYLTRFESDIKPKIANSVKEIADVIGLDYFGIDCCIDSEFNLIIFEVNANMDILDLNGDYTDPYTHKINNAVIQLIEKHLT
ncbi:ATP-grasp domain-containing protein [Pseudoalteromonas gelatinilytica]